MLQKHRGNHRGFTLIELVVSASILGIVVMIAMGLMATGASTYSSVSYSLRMQYEAQLALAQLQDAIMDCNAGVVWDGETLAVLDTEQADPTRDKLRLFRYDSDDQCIYYGSGAPHAADLSADDLLAEHVTAFSVSLVNGVDLNHAKLANVELAFQRHGSSYTGSQTIALRNEPLMAGDLSALLTAVYP